MRPVRISQIANTIDPQLLFMRMMFISLCKTSRPLPVD
jgi:hypothetical protein